MCIEAITNYSAFITTAATFITALTTIVLAFFNGKLLNQMDKQYKSDSFFKAFPFRRDEYSDIKKQYEEIIDRNDFKIWHYEGLRGKSPDEINNIPKPNGIEEILCSLHKAKLFFSKDISDLIVNTIDKINEHDKNLRIWCKTENISEKQEPVKIQCEKTHKELKTAFQELIARMESFLKFERNESKGA